MTIINSITVILLVTFVLVIQEPPMPKINKSSIFYDQFLAFRRRINYTLLEFITSLPFNKSDLVMSIRYSALLGGKRLRPLLVYATGQMFGITSNNLDAPAAAIECIHAYSLIHDDLPAMDNSTLRRGMPACHIKYGETNAILAGDALQSLAFSILSDAKMPDVALPDRLAMISELASASGAAGMCAGQAMDFCFEGKNADLINIEQIHRYKTGALIRSAIRLGALAANNSSPGVLSLLERYAVSIGLAFQIQDDILDVIGEINKIGKHRGKDKEYQKSTYPALVGINQAKIKLWELYEESVSALNALSEISYDTSLLRIVTDFIMKRES